MFNKYIDTTAKDKIIVMVTYDGSINAYTAS